jgi:hypothetical protein
MSAKSNSFEGGTTGATITAANSGGTSGDAFTSVPTISGTLAYDSALAAHGTISAKLTGGGTDALSVIYDITPATSFAVRGYFYLTSLPTADHWLIAMYATNHTTRLLSMHINSAGKLRLSDGSGTTGVWTAAATMPLNQWVRIELYGSCGSSTANATVKGGVYLGDSTIPIETIYSTSTGNLGAAQQFGRAVIGKVNSSTFATPYWVDDIKADDTATDLPGPYSAITTPPTITSNTQAATDAAVVTVVGAPAAAGTLAYSIAQTAGTTTAPLIVSTGKWAIPRHATSTLAYTVTVTESPSGLTVTSAVSVLPQGASGGDAVRIRNATNGWI